MTQRLAFGMTYSTCDLARMPDAFDTWLAHLEARHLANLTLPEVARALRALSSAYVERRQTAIPARRVLDGAGKRAAFALYYGPLHFLAARHALQEMLAGSRLHMPGTPVPIVDLGCGTGVGGAAAASVTGATRVTGIDTHPWALDEARDTYTAFGLSPTLSRGSVARFRAPRQPAFIVAGYVINEIADEERTRLLSVVADAVHRGSQLMIVEPLAKSTTPWWAGWAQALAAHHPDEREWKLTVDAPSIVRRLGEAAGLTATRINIRTLVAGCGMTKGTGRG